MLIAGGADVSTKDDSRFTALMQAAYNRHPEIMNLLESATKNDEPKSAEELIRSLNKDLKKLRKSETAHALLSRAKSFIIKEFLAEKSLEQMLIRMSFKAVSSGNMIYIYLHMEEDDDGKYYFLDHKNDLIKGFFYDPHETPDSLL